MFKAKTNNSEQFYNYQQIIQPVTKYVACEIVQIQLTKFQATFEISVHLVKHIHVLQPSKYGAAFRNISYSGNMYIFGEQV